jgi:hypothetical protein
MPTVPSFIPQGDVSYIKPQYNMSSLNRNVIFPGVPQSLPPPPQLAQLMPPPTQQPTNANFENMLSSLGNMIMNSLMPIESGFKSKSYIVELDDDIIDDDIKIEVQLKKINLKDLKMHEEFSIEKLDDLYNYYNNLADNLKIIPTILVDIKTNVIIDGHHRYQLLKKLGYENVEVSCFDYLSCDTIIVNPNDETIDKKTIDKKDVINMGLSNELYTSKRTQHMVKINNKLRPIIYLSTNILSYFLLTIKSSFVNA